MKEEKKGHGKEKIWSYDEKTKTWSCRIVEIDWSNH
jgi:hypothetical protein